MTPPNSEFPRDALSAEEREMATRLARLDAGGPSSALDARILASARAATRARRWVGPRGWPAALGSVAIVVATVGLAYQLHPMFDFSRLRPPIREQAAQDGHGTMEAEVLARVEHVPRREQPTTEAAADATAAAAPAPAVAPRVAASASTARRVTTQIAPPVARSIARSGPSAQASPRASAKESAGADTAVVHAAPASVADASAETVEATGSRIPSRLGALSTDYSLLPDDWLDRIRARRDAGDTARARESLRRFMLRHPHVRVPDDLRALQSTP